jgi:hypothetical protein
VFGRVAEAAIGLRPAAPAASDAALRVRIPRAGGTVAARQLFPAWLCGGAWRGPGVGQRVVELRKRADGAPTPVQPPDRASG